MVFHKVLNHNFFNFRLDCPIQKKMELPLFQISKDIETFYTVSNHASQCVWGTPKVYTI